jgi:alpha-tubulin suppressor-like RCC1 family protein
MSLRRPNGFISAGYDPLQVPNAPTIGVATFASDTSVSVTFTAPSNVGGSAIIEFVANAKKTSDGTTISGTGSSSPVTISGLTTGEAYTVTVAAVNSFGLGVSSAASNSVTPLAQELYSWGSGNSGRLGIGSTTDRSSPVQVGALNTWSYVAAGGGAFSAATKTDGTLWAWGENSYGALGQNNITLRSSPVQIGALTNWLQPSAGFAFCAATKTDGTLWGWGYNTSGQLGLNDVVNRSSPVQVGALTNWLQVSVGGLNVPNCAAIKTDGTLWSWGLGNDGRLGLNNTINRSSPVQVGALTTWAQVAVGDASCAAVKTDGTLWTWGSGTLGRLGHNNTISLSSPVQVGALTAWVQVSVGNQHTAAVKTDGTLWMIGGNGYQGQLGIGTAVPISSPVQVGALTNWLRVSAGGNFCSAIKTDSSLWIWGSGTDGRLGQNDTITRSSPVQVGSLTTWQKSSSGSGSVLAIKG